MLDAALLLDFDSAASANVGLLGAFWVLPYVSAFAVSACVSKERNRADRDHPRRA